MDTARRIRDTTGMDAVLIGNANSSNYQFARPTAFNKSIVEEQRKRMNVTTIESIVEKKQPGLATMKAGLESDSIGNLLFWNKKSDSVFAREKIISRYILTSEIKPDIKWNIVEEVKMIKNFTCLKATTEFRGRKYTAWFTPDIPISDGPWKFKGLPGLILSITDEDFQVFIYATDIEFPSKESVVSYYKNGHTVSMSDYFTLLQKEITERNNKVDATLKSLQGLDNSSPSLVDPKAYKLKYYSIEKRF
jgi:GLPGLI family protein